MKNQMLILLALCFQIQVLGQPLRLDLGTHITQNSDTLEIEITSDNFTNIASLQFSINWNTEQLQFLNWENQQLTSNLVIGDTEVILGNLQLSWFSQNPSGLTLANNEVLLRLQFLVNTCREEMTFIDITDNPLPIEIYQVENSLPQQINLEVFGGIINNFPISVNLGNDTILYNSQTLTLNPFCSNCDFIWSDNTTLPFLEITETGNYAVTVTNNFGCTASDALAVEFIDNFLDLIPIINVITPNNDQENDQLDFCNLNLFNQNKLVIFNRWGQTVYESIDYQNDWQGTYKGKPLPAGVYYYILSVSGTDKQLKSALTILRN